MSGRACGKQYTQWWADGRDEGQKACGLLACNSATRHETVGAGEEVKHRGGVVEVSCKRARQAARTVVCHTRAQSRGRTTHGR